MNQLPPIFKVNSTNIKNINQQVYPVKVNNEKTQEEAKGKETVHETLDKIFKTKGYAFNVPVTVYFAGKRLDTYLALRKNDSIITLDNEVIPISIISKIEIKNPST